VRIGFGKGRYRSIPTPKQPRTNMASTLQAVAGPRFLLPKISRRVTSIRPTSIAALGNTSNRLYEYDSGRLRATAIRQNDAQSCSNTHNPYKRSSIHQRLANTSFWNTSRALSRPFSSTASRFRDHHFDTLKFVQRLKDEGFTEEQAVAMMKVLSDVIEERQAHQHTRQMCTPLIPIQHSKPNPHNGSP
jgi:hypothetical protein